MPTHEWHGRPHMSSAQLYMMQVEDKLSKLIWLSPGEIPKDIAIKSGETQVYGTQLCHHANFHADQREMSVPGKKYIFFLI